MFKIKRIYDSPEKDDGFRVLIDRLWPRGMSKERARIDLWLKEIAPSDALRKWFHHDPGRWTQFVAKYRMELKTRKDAVRKMKELEAARGRVTLLYSSHDPERNQAVVLRQFLKGTRSR